MIRALFLNVALGLHPIAAMIFLNNADPAANKQTAPTGSYANAGWQYQVRYKDYLGTMISPKHFITATHLGQSGATSQPMFFNGMEDRAFTLKNGGTRLGILNTDLSIFEIWETFENYAPLYTVGNETGKEVFITGRGRNRGEEILRNGELVGWKWGDSTTEADRWGVNEITSFLTSNGNDFLYTTFDNEGGIHECQLAGNDSGGGWFLKDGNIWKLAAITSSVDANHDTNNTSGDNSHFRAAFTKARGFYYGRDQDGWNLIPTRASQYNNPSFYNTNPSDIRFYDRTHSYASRIQTNLTEINTIIQPAISLATLNPTRRLESWLSDFGITTENASDDDPDEDGISNLVEYFANTDPSVSNSSSFKIIELADGAIQFTSTESLDLSGRNLTGTIQVSNDLESWSPLLNLNEQSNLTDNVAGNRTRILTLTSPAELPVFYRFKVSLAD